MSDANTMTDHQAIREWAEQRGGQPATVRTTADDGDAGILRIRFQGESDDGLEDISWDGFFEKFEEEKLAFLHQDRTADGSESRFHKFVDRN